MHVNLLAEKLAKRGHECTIFGAPESALFKDAQNRSLNFKYFKPNGYFDPISIYKYSQILKNSVDLVHVHYSKDLWTIVPALMPLHNVPLVFIKHVGTGKAKKDIFHRFLYHRVDHTIAISQVIKNNLIATHPISPEKISIVHHGIDMEEYRYDVNACEQIRRELQIANDEIVIGTIGRLQIGKGHLEFLEMAGRITTLFKNIKFLIIGDPTHGEEDKAQPIYQKAKDLKLEDNVLFLGFRKDIPRYLSAMDIFAFPSHAEAFGLVVIEAMAAARPVVSSKCDGVLDIITNEQDGMLVDPKNVDELTNAVRFLIENPDERLRLGENAVKTVYNRFTTSKMLDKIEEIYKNVIKAKTTKLSGDQNG